MGKTKRNLALQMALVTGLLGVCAAHAEDMMINCASDSPDAEKCAALYNDQMFLPTDGQALAAQQNQAPGTQERFLNATPNADVGMESGAQQQVVFRDTAVPLAVSQPMDEMEELGSEYAFYKTNKGGLVVERDVSQTTMDDGSIVQTTRNTETTVTPSYVEMPSITAYKRSDRITFGDSVHDWEANSGDSLRTLLINWGQKSGWTVVWKLDRDYILEAGVVFRGTFTDVSSAIIRTFARAVPAPIGTFYKGNRVLVINTQEDDNA